MLLIVQEVHRPIYVASYGAIREKRRQDSRDREKIEPREVLGFALLKHNVNVRLIKNKTQTAVINILNLHIMT